MELLYENAATRPSREMFARVLPFEGVENFRDMGGCRTRDGRRVKYGYLYRSSALFFMTPADMRLFESLGIRYILDYRNASEALAEPNPGFVTAVQERIPAVAEDDFCYDVYLSQSYRERLRPNGLADYYRTIAVNEQAYTRLLTACLDPRNRAILHHCAAGKDRTGVGAAVFYMALSVPRDIIMEDYLLSNLYLRRYMRGQLEKVAEHYTAQELRYFNGYPTCQGRVLAGFF